MGAGVEMPWRWEGEASEQLSEPMHEAASVSYPQTDPDNYRSTSGIYRFVLQSVRGSCCKVYVDLAAK